MKKVLVCASLIALSASAFAAESKSGVYVRGDIGASKMFAGTQKGKSPLSGDFNDVKPVYSVGVGYKFDNNFRADVNAQLRNSKHESNEREYKSKAVFVNGYYDFDSSSIFTPYVTAGVGYAQNNMNKLATGNTNVEVRNVAYNAGFGSKVNVAKDVDLDFGYKFVNLGKFKSKAGETTAELKAHAHELSAGVIFSF